MTQNDLFGTPSWMLHRGTPDTSVEAAESVDTTRLEEMVYNAIKMFGETGCIGADLLARYSMFPYSSITARFAALERKGLITCGPDKRKGPSGRQQRVMRAIEGRAISG